ncbi:response regulator [Perlabentimonas gracilis]|uniref:response regulator n=1 Tax=Perlabentimonas gracilis TaxID=2715279 RepID=UPI001409DA13|nr:response regulator [Perlabentimonas gracilis]NHB70000.1 response regulator [Perlabentimonas gracilis]
MTLLNYNVLIADDNRTFANTLAMLIKNILGNKLGKLDFALNGKEAIDMAFGETHYDIIFMDVHMPEMDGIEATQIINRIHYRSTRIVAVSFEKDMNSVTRMISAGAVNYLHKENITMETIERLFGVNVL